VTLPRCLQDCQTYSAFSFLCKHRLYFFKRLALRAKTPDQPKLVCAIVTVGPHLNAQKKSLWTTCSKSTHRVHLFFTNLTP
jgi:hypothetical protein